jgi:transcriptional regulator
MYHVPRYQQTDPAVIHDFIEEYPFALLTGISTAGHPVATHLPLLLKEENGQYFLEGHCMKGTDHHHAFADHDQVLVVFSGPHAYISASWYQQPQQASTWNYMAVHVHGKLVYQPAETLPAMLQDLTSHFEGNPASPASYDQIPEEYVQRMVKAIDGFRIYINDMRGIFKLSQNRDEQSYQQIIEQLEQRDASSAAIAKAMRKEAVTLFVK